MPAIAFDDGETSETSSNSSVESPSAEKQRPRRQRTTTCRHRQSQRQHRFSADAVGRYAVRIRFDDGADTGLYSVGSVHDLRPRQK
ncbi:MAG: DUF971 domain-containing protein [Caulobacteraceae bacterium]|nr:DUF971 domain-containing protein [Caulobacteraceae bacterium]